MPQLAPATIRIGPFKIDGLDRSGALCRVEEVERGPQNPAVFGLIAGVAEGVPIGEWDGDRSRCPDPLRQVGHHRDRDR